MSKTKQATLFISIILLISWLFYKFGFLIVLSLTAPTQEEIDRNEINLFNEIRQELNIKEIERAPRYNIAEAQDTISYDLFLKDIDCEKYKDSLEEIAITIATRANNRISLNKNVYKIEIVFQCEKTPPISLKYKFFRNDL
ncbi:hypothetical protein ACFSX9_14060 [Flavobacterium ardleyense]|uniref:Lipoprotein n=1 Tax=Flavobacterium ardleyense TaxID=2038737 RepID=A0ABW5ZAD9_9FLAO